MFFADIIIHVCRVAVQKYDISITIYNIIWLIWQSCQQNGWFIVLLIARNSEDPLWDWKPCPFRWTILGPRYPWVHTCRRCFWSIFIDFHTNEQASSELLLKEIKNNIQHQQKRWLHPVKQLKDSRAHLIKNIRSNSLVDWTRFSPHCLVEPIKWGVFEWWIIHDNAANAEYLYIFI